ncbi:E3 ubiquitin-protein ligase TRIM45-like [Mytilus edulis]|uniref:E3 ubiquitin-protein ligase TRIM45-like n=1 Tax=Mytilus edulis TaxID=6550 RepID=UPI0039EEEB52
MAEGCDSKCGICLSFVFTEPKLLNCYHTFCLPCLQKLDIKDNKIICPLCKTTISLPDEGVSGLKPYPYKLKYVKVNNEVMDACDLCDDQNFAVSKCLDCKTNLCSNCRDYHGKLKTSKNHVIRSLKILKSEKLDQTEATVKTKCKEHSKELTLFCRPCNTLLCFDCSEEIHPCHQVENLSSILQNKKEMLLVRIASFKARISFLQNTAEMVKLKEDNYNKHCLVLKHNVKERATNLKDRFCSAVDELTNKNLDIIDDIKKKDIEKLDKYMNQIETDKISLSGLIMTTENYVNQSSDTHFLEEFSVIGKRLDETLRKSVNIFPSIHNLNYEWDDVSSVVIEKIFGEITATEKEKEVKPMYPHLPVPELSLLPAHKVVKRSEFVVSNEVLDIIPTNNDNAWLLTAGMACRYSSKGIKDESIDTHADIKHFVHKSASRVCFGMRILL